MRKSIFALAFLLLAAKAHSMGLGAGVCVVCPGQDPFPVISTVTWNYEDFTGDVDGASTTFNLQAVPNPGSDFVILDGVVQRSGVDYTLTSATVEMSTAPAAGSSSFFVKYSTGAGGAGSSPSPYSPGVWASSAPVHSVIIDTLSDVAVATVTASAVGGRPIILHFDGTLENTSGAKRTYTLTLKMDGVALSPVFSFEVTAGEIFKIASHGYVSTASAGSRVFTAEMTSSSTNVNQTVQDMIITVSER